MPSNVTKYSILLSAPSDIAEEIDIVKRVIAEFNKTVGQIQSIVLEARYWKDDTFPQMGNTAQEIINRQIVDTSDAVIAIFWTRFGTPTENYGSGTEEEIERLLESGKQVFLYFSDRGPDRLGNLDLEQLNRVRLFRKSCESRGLSYSYDNLDDFAQAVHRHLVLYFMNLKDEEIASHTRSLSSLTVQCFSDLDIVTNLTYLERKPTKSKWMKERFDEVVSLLKEIGDFRITLSSPPTDPLQQTSLAHLIGGGMTPYVFPEEQAEVISSFCVTHGIKIPEGLFYLGHLKEPRNRMVFPFSREDFTDGSESEKQKFSRLRELHTKVQKFSCLKRFMQELEGFSYLQLVLTNRGKRPDRNIDVTLFLPGRTLVRSDEFPVPGEFCIDTVLQFHGAYVAPPENHSVEQYADYPPFPTTIPYPPVLQDRKATYESAVRRFKDTLGYHLCYDLYQDDDSDIVKVHFSYLKHNEAVFFPSVLLLKKPAAHIRYEIRSEENPTVVTGTLLGANDKEMLAAGRDSRPG